MKKIQKAQFIPVLLALLLVIALAVPAMPSEGIAAQSTVNLGTASSFGVLAGSEITNTGTTWIGGSAGGDVGLHPGTAFTGSEDVTIENGDIYIDDAVAEQAKVDLVTAYNDAAGRESDETIAADLGGRTLTPGVYTSASSIGITGTLTLDAQGDPNAVFIFQAGSTLTTASDSEIVLINDAQPCRVFWQVGSSATLGTNSNFVGHILAMESITVTTGAEVQGQLLARNGAVTLDTNIITNDFCLPEDEETDPDLDPDYGSLTVDKVVTGDTGDMELPDFEITVTGPEGFTATRTFEDGESYTWEDLLPGEYTVTEENLGADWDVVVAESPVEVEADETAAVTVTNTFEEDDPTPIVDPDIEIALEKEWELGEDVVEPEEWTVEAFVDGEVVASIGPGEETDSFEISPGDSYRVEESGLENEEEWFVDGTGDNFEAPDDDYTHTVSNIWIELVDPDPDYGSLTVDKVVTGDTGDMELPDFQITVTGPEGFMATRTFVDGESFTWENLMPGIYTVTEENLGADWDIVVAESPVEVEADETAAVTVTNTFEEVEEVDLEPELTIDPEKESELPRTGGMTLLMQLFGGLIAGAGVLLYVKKK